MEDPTPTTSTAQPKKRTREKLLRPIAPQQAEDTDVYLHYYRQIGGGATYTQPNHGGPRDCIEPKKGFEWTHSEALCVAAPQHPESAAATAPAGGMTPSTVFFPCVDDPDNTRLELWDLIDAYAEARHKHGEPEYSAVAHAARVKVLDALTTAARAAEPDTQRLAWLHSPASNDVEGYEWGIYRVKWEYGRAVEVWQTAADMSDLDEAIRKSKQS